MIGLLDLLDEHGEAVEYDLITLGLRLRDLGTPALPWRDLLVIVRQSPRTSAVARSMYVEQSAWGLPEQLLASILDALSAANWQRGGGKGPRPAPLTRPGVESNERRMGRARPLDEVTRWLGWDQDTDREVSSGD